jgi:hypothetical protein
MPKYAVHFATNASATVTVEAENKEAAIDLAYDALPGSLCAQCCGWGEEWSRDEGDFELVEDDPKVGAHAVELVTED